MFRPVGLKPSQVPPAAIRWHINDNLQTCRFRSESEQVIPVEK